MRMEPILQVPSWALLHQVASRRLSVRAMARVAAGTAADPVPEAEVPDGGIRQIDIPSKIMEHIHLDDFSVPSTS